MRRLGGITLLILLALGLFFGTARAEDMLEGDDYPIFQDEFDEDGLLQGKYQWADTRLAEMQPTGFADEDEAKEKLVALVEARDWLGFQDYVAMETIVEAFYLAGEGSFADIFSAAMARRFFAYDDSLEFELQLREETDLSLLNQYTLIYDNLRAEDYPIFFFLEMRGGRWYLLADTQAANFRMYEMFTLPDGVAIEDKIALASGEYAAVPLYTLYDRNGRMTPAIFVSRAPGLARFELETEVGKLEIKAEAFGDARENMLIRAGMLVSAEPFSEIRGLTLVTAKGEKIPYELIW